VSASNFAGRYEAGVPLRSRARVGAVTLATGTGPAQAGPPWARPGRENADGLRSGTSWAR